MEPAAPAAATDAVLVQSESLPEGTPTVQGLDFSAFAAEGRTPTVDDLARSMLTTGFQATNLGLAIQEIEAMLNWRLSHEPVREDEGDDLRDPAVRASTRAKVFLSYTSNLVSSGLRETLRFLVQHRLVDVVVTTAGGVEEDIIKCLAPTYMGDFALKGAELRRKGINRIGNLLVPNDNYVRFEEFMHPLLRTMTDEQEEQGIRWTPSRFIHRLGKEINDESSICYWAYKNNIPIYSPALTDGSIGDMIFFHMYKRPEFVLDIAQDIREMNDQALHAQATGMVILGGGLVKHHVANANLMRNGAKFSVYINTAQEFDGSDSGARPDEAVSWGKIRIDARPVKVYAEATLVFPLIVHQTFFKELLRRRQEAEAEEAGVGAEGPAEPSEGLAQR